MNLKSEKKTKGRKGGATEYENPEEKHLRTTFSKRSYYKFVEV